MQLESSVDVIADGSRLSALRELGMLDTDPELELDRFTALTSDLLGVPVSTLTLVDRDRQFWKSAHGLTGAWAAARETPLSHSLCQQPVATGEPLIISDARVDDRVGDNLAVRDLSAVAYAGVPLVLSDGFAVGALCAIDHEPHEWSERDVRVLTDLAKTVSAMLDLRRALNQQTLHDPLTGLPNRLLTVAYGEQLTVAGEESELLALAVGLDDLGHVNELHGVAHTDEAIALAARRIAHQLAPDDVLGRLQNDVFIVLRPWGLDSLQAMDLAHRLRAAVSGEPATLAGKQVVLSASIGIAHAGAGITGDALIGRSLASLEQARVRVDKVAVFAPGSGEEAAVRSRLRSALAGAVRRGEIVVNFQPIVELATGRTAGYESLARWRHPELGLIGPSEFIPLAEASGDIVMIGEHVMRSACEQLALWRAMMPGDELGVTVNVSPLQLAVANIADVVEGILIDTGLPGSALTLEITEGVLISPGALQRRNLEAIRELDVQIALDDFGTGYSALGYLKRLPVDIIKVDRCFLEGFETDHRDAALMRAILAIGSGMDLDVIVEGVETRAQREMLRLSGCHWGQGFLFSEPLPADQIRVPRGGGGLGVTHSHREKIVAAPE